jgi:pilus assembly protein FimV
MIVLDRLVRSLAAPPSWKSTVLTWSIAMLAVPLATMSLNVQAQRPAASSHASHAAGGSNAGGTGEGASTASGMADNAQSGAAASAGASHAGNAGLSMPEHYTVQKGQWLTDIAGELTDSTDPTVKQNMANALYAANPNAFFANNPNRLKVGAVLNVPRPNGSVPSGATAGVAAHAASGAKLAAPAAEATTAHMASTSAGTATTPATGSASAAAMTAGAAVHTNPAATTDKAQMASVAATAGTAALGASTTARAASVPGSSTTTGAAAAAGGSATMGAAAASGGSATMSAAAVSGASATSNIAMAGGASASPAAMTAATPSSAALGEGGASAVLSSASPAIAGLAAASSAISSDAAAAMAASGGGAAASGAAVPATASSAHAWTGAIAPPPAAALTASGADAASGPAGAQNVSSLQQLLQLKNRVLAAMQAHGLGSRASTVAAAGLPVSATLPGASIAPASGVPPSRAGALQGPLAIPALVVVLIVVLVAIWICLPARKRKPASPANGRSQDAPSDAGGPDAAVAGEGKRAGFAPGAVTAGAAIAGAATAAYAAQALPHGSHPESRDEEARADDEAGAAPEGVHEAAHDATHEAGPDGNVDVPDEEERHPQLDTPPFSLEEGAAGGLPTHDPQRGAFAEEARTPYDTGLLIGLLEMHAHRREVARFEELAHELWELTDGDGPDWRRAASMGRGIDPDNPLYADDPFAAYRSEHDANSGFAKPLPDIDLDLPASQSDSPPAPAPASGDAAFEHAAQAGVSPSTHDAEPLPEATPPAHVPVSEAHDTLPLGLTDADRPAPSAADEIEHGTSGAGSVAGLGAGTTELHSDVPGTDADALRGSDAGSEHTGAGGTAASNAPGASGIPAHAATPGIGAPSFGALKLDFDLELTPNAAAPGSSPNSQDLATIARNKLDLATEYIDLGDRSGARTLLNEVLATQDPATRERAQALLATLA